MGHSFRQFITGRNEVVAKVMFLLVSVILFTCLRQTPPQEQTPPGADPPRADPPQSDIPPPGPDSSIRSTSGRYASYWNAFLLLFLAISLYVNYPCIVKSPI